MPIEVVLVTQAVCDLCNRAHAVLDRLGHQYDLSVRTVSLTTPEGEALARATIHSLLEALKVAPA